MINDIIYDFKVEINDENQNGYISDVQISIFKQIVNNPTFLSYWRDFKNLCKHKING